MNKAMNKSLLHIAQQQGCGQFVIAPLEHEHAVATHLEREGMKQQQGVGNFVTVPLEYEDARQRHADLDKDSRTQRASEELDL